MNAYDFVHLTIHALGDKVQGKTKLQKMVYFLGIMTGVIDDLGYRAHFYGPYSDEVAKAVERLKSLGFVDQIVARSGVIDSRGFDVTRYDYCLNEEGKKIADKKAQKYQAVWQNIQDSIQTLQQAGDMNYLKLSIAAKTYFMLDEKTEKVPISQFSQLSRRFGWSVSEQDVREAVSFLKLVGLVQDDD